MVGFDRIKQTSACQSGLICLSMICRYYGRHVELATMLSVEDSLQEVSNNAEKLGLNSIIGYLPLAKLGKVTLPCLLYWDDEYYVVLRKVKRNVYYIADPRKGFTKCKETDMKRHWICSCQDNDEKGAAIFIKPSDEFYRQAEAQNQLIKENPIKRYFKNLLCGKDRIL